MEIRLPLFAVGNGSFFSGVEGVIASAADVHAGMDLRPALADQDFSCPDLLPVGALYPKHFWLRIAPKLC